MLKSSLCDYSDVYVPVKERIKITGAGYDAAARQADERNKDVIFKNCARLLIVKVKLVIQKQIMLKILIQ